MTLIYVGPFCVTFHVNLLKVRKLSSGLGRTLALQEVEATRICRHSAYEGDKVVRPTHRPPLSTRRYPLYYFLLEAELTQSHNGAGRIKSMKNLNDYIGTYQHFGAETFVVASKFLENLCASELISK